MKTVMIIMIALMGLTSDAQSKNSEQHERRPQTKSVMKDLTPEEAAQLKTKRMTLHLDLNESQQNKIQSIILEEEIVKQKKRKEREAIRKDDQKPTKEEHLAMINERLDRKIEMKSKMKSILNAEQFEKWEHMIQQKDKHRRKSKGKKER